MNVIMPRSRKAVLLYSSYEDRKLSENKDKRKR